MLNSNYYDSIDEMLLFNWRRCQEKGEYVFMRRNMDEEDGRKVSEEKDLIAWEKVYGEYIDEFGWGKFFERVWELKEQIALAKCDYIIENRRYLLNEVNSLQAELDELLNREVDGDMDTCIIHLSRWMTYRINDRETTVREFFKMLNEFEKELEQMKKAS